jgi:hypothetical protein
MLRTHALEASLWEAALPGEVLRLPEELARGDALLDDPAFFAPFEPFFDPRLGRPSTPMEVYLRLCTATSFRIQGPGAGAHPWPDRSNASGSRRNKNFRWVGRCRVAAAVPQTH